MSVTAVQDVGIGGATSGRSWRVALHGPKHGRYVMVFMFVVLVHVFEHVVQAAQIWLLGWDRKEAMGMLGELFPWLVSSESLHYAYAVITLAGLILLRPGFTGTARTWWTVALVIQLWHHFEHLLLLGQAIASQPLFGQAKPTSIVQLLVPRVELHIFYNAVVLTPMVIAVYHHYFASAARRSRHRSLGTHAG